MASEEEFLSEASGGKQLMAGLLQPQHQAGVVSGYITSIGVSLSIWKIAGALPAPVMASEKASRSNLQR